MILPLLVIATLLVSAASNLPAVHTNRSAAVETNFSAVDAKPSTVDMYLSAEDTKSRIAIGKKAKTLFQQNCAKCHGRDGKGQTAKGQIAGAPDFTNGKWHELSEDQELASSIRHGRGQMPSFGGKLNNEQIKSLVAYVRAFRK